MGSDRFAGRREFEEVCKSCRVRETCAVSRTDESLRARDRAARVHPLEVGKTALEAAVVKIIPQWPEAWHALLEYMRSTVPAGLTLRSLPDETADDDS